MNPQQVFDIHGCDLSNLVRVADTFKRGVIRLWNWDDKETKARYISVVIKIPNLPVKFNYYCGSAGRDRDEWFKEANAWVDAVVAVSGGWTVERQFSLT